MITDCADALGVDYIVIDGLKSNLLRPKFFGLIRTVDLEEGDYKDENIKQGLGFIDRLGPQDVLFVNGSTHFAYFGELMSRFSIAKGISGVIIDGATRDTDFTKTIELPIMFKAVTPVDIKLRGRVKTVDQPIFVQGKTVESFDFVFADSDAAVILNLNDLTSVESAVALEIQNEKKIKKMLQDEIPILKIIEEFGSF